MENEFGRTMIDMGEAKIPNIESEDDLRQALQQAATYEEMEAIVDQYNSMFDESYRGGQSWESYAAKATLGGPHDYAIACREFNDYDAVVVQRNKFTDLVKKRKMAVGDRVRVVRTSGDAEKDWHIESIDNDYSVTVRKDNLTKKIPYSSLLEYNATMFYFDPNKI